MLSRECPTLGKLSKSNLFLAPTSTILKPFATRWAEKLPESFELSVRVHDCRDVVHGVINSNSEIVGHIRFSFAAKPRDFPMFCWHREARRRLHNA